MAEAKGPLLNPLDDLKAIIFILVLFWIVWYLNGGPAKYEASQKALLHPSWPIGEGGSYGDLPNKITIKTGVNGTPATGEVDYTYANGKLIPVSGPTSNTSQSSDKKTTNNTVPINVSPKISWATKLQKGEANSDGQSYIALDFPVSNQSSIDLSGMIVKSLFSGSLVINKASNLPYQGLINNLSDIVAQPGSRVYLIEGESPIGVSFRVNKCFGYLTQFQKYFPPIEVSCPDCRYDKSSDQNYNSCVRNKKNDQDFFANDWRIYLNNSTKAWNETGDIIRLLDKDGTSISNVLY